MIYFWFKGDAAPIKGDMGAIPGWHDEWRSFLEDKAAKLNTPNRYGRYFVGDEKANELSVDWVPKTFSQEVAILLKVYIDKEEKARLAKEKV